MKLPATVSRPGELPGAIVPPAPMLTSPPTEPEPPRTPPLPTTTLDTIEPFTFNRPESTVVGPV